MVGAEPTIILPAKYVMDIKSLPENTASFKDAIYRQMIGEYTGLGIIEPAMVRAVKNDLTNQLGKTLGGLQDEADFCIPNGIGECNDWTPVHFYPVAARIVAHLSGRIFVGAPLCREEEWLKTTIAYTFDCFNAVPPIKGINRVLRPFKVHGLPEYKVIQKDLDTGVAMLRPIVERRLEEMKDPNFDPPTDMIHFILKNSRSEADKNDMILQCHAQLMLSLAAIHTTAMNTTNVIYDMCMHPEYIAPLREEIEEVLAISGGKFIKSNMIHLRKMDSFIKESQRLNPPAMGMASHRGRVL